MKRFPLPLRYSIPMMLLFMGSLLSFYSFHREVNIADQHHEEELLDYAQFSGSRTAGILEYLYRQVNGQGTPLVIGQLGNEVNLRLAVLLDQNNRVALSTQVGQQGQPMEKVVPAASLSLIPQVRLRVSRQVVLSSDRQQVYAAYPVPLQPQPGEVRSSRIGVLLLTYDLARFQQESRNDSLRRALEATIGLAGLCLAVWFFFNKTVTLRVNHLVKTSQQLADGDLKARANLGGSDELAQIANAFNRMAATIQANTEDLQTSQANLARAHHEVSQQAEELRQTLQELQRTQSQLVQTEKMSSLGQLVAGIAHEINNPVNFIHGNLSPLQEYAQDLLHVLELYQQHYPKPAPEILAEVEAVDLDFIQKDLPKTLASMQIGTDRIRQIVLSLRNFSRTDEADIKAVNIHDGIDSTLLILQHRLKATPHRPEIEVVKDYGELPLVECYAGQLNQVFMNILSNAIDALEQANENRTYEEIQENPNCITIRTSVIRHHWVEIAIRDNGPGMPKEVQEKIFNPFFTTKPIGKGTGMGMSISYQVIAEKHNGELECCSTPNQGTVFMIKIPTCQTIPHPT